MGRKSKVGRVLSDAEFDQLIERARRRNRHRDQVERSNGFAAPCDCPPDIWVRTVLAALRSGTMTETWDCIAEGYAMLEHYASNLPRTR